MSKVELAGRPEPGYESMEQFAVGVEHVAEMLRTIDFQPGERASEAAGRGRPAGRGEAGLTGASCGAGAFGDDDDEEAALDAEDGGAGPEEERLDAPEGEGARTARRAGLLRIPAPSPAARSPRASRGRAACAGDQRPLARVQKPFAARSGEPG